MGGGGKQQEVKYVGPSKEEIAAQRQQYESTVSMLQQQNAALGSQFEGMQKNAQQDYATKTSLMEDALNKQKLAYDEVLGTTRQSLADSNNINTQQQETMRGLAEKQQQTAAVQQASAEKDTLMAQEQTKRNRTDVTSSMASQGKARKRRGLLSVLSGNY